MLNSPAGQGSGMREDDPGSATPSSSSSARPQPHRLVEPRPVPAAEAYPVPMDIDPSSGPSSHGRAPSWGSSRGPQAPSPLPSSSSQIPPGLQTHPEARRGDMGWEQDVEMESPGPSRTGSGSSGMSRVGAYGRSGPTGGDVGPSRERMPRYSMEDRPPSERPYSAGGGQGPSSSGFTTQGRHPPGPSPSSSSSTPAYGAYIPYQHSPVPPPNYAAPGPRSPHLSNPTPYSSNSSLPPHPSDRPPYPPQQHYQTEPPFHPNPRPYHRDGVDGPERPYIPPASAPARLHSPQYPLHPPPLRQSAPPGIHGPRYHDGYSPAHPPPPFLPPDRGASDYRRGPPYGFSGDTSRSTSDSRESTPQSREQAFGTPPDRRRPSSLREDSGESMEEAGSSKKRRFESDGGVSQSRADFGLSGYRLVMCQQPERARLCSFKEENDTIDRRPVDPPPVVQIISQRHIQVGDMLETSSFFVRTRLVASQPTDAPAWDLGNGRMSSPDPQQWPEQRLPQGNEATTGESLQTPEKLRDLDGREGAFCVFGRLSIRMPGIFRLRFVLYETKESGVEEITSCLSEPFEVFSPKLFKGMKQSTALTRHFASQGLKIKLRQEAASKSRKKKGDMEVTTSTSMETMVSGPAPFATPEGRSPMSASGSLPANRSERDRAPPPFGGSASPSGLPSGSGKAPIILPPLSAAVGDPSVWYANSKLIDKDAPLASRDATSGQGGVIFKDGIRHGGDDGMLPPMSFGRLPKQIYDGNLSSTSGIFGTSDLASFSLKNIGAVGSPSATNPASNAGHFPFPTAPMNSQSIKSFDEDLHRLFDEPSPRPGGQVSSLRTGMIEESDPLLKLPPPKLPAPLNASEATENKTLGLIPPGGLSTQESTKTKTEE